MKIKFFKGLTAMALLALMSFTLLPQDKITVYMIGDSTMANKQVKTYPETGWGMPFSWFFDQTVTVDNRAQNGRSTKSFIAEKRWDSVMQTLKEGDYVIIEFGHNDEVPTKKTYTPEAEFKANLVKFIVETRSKKATPILLTPVARRKFDASGNVQGTHDAYSELVRQVAVDQKVAFIDMDKEWQAAIQKYGVENSKMLYNHLVPGENPNYPDGKQDDTHFNELGARKVAQIALTDIKNLNLELANRIVKGSNAPTVAPAAK